jgi:hypothetical protein
MAGMAAGGGQSTKDVAVMSVFMKAALGIKRLTVADLCTDPLASPSPSHCAFMRTLSSPFRSAAFEFVLRSPFPYFSAFGDSGLA